MNFFEGTREKRRQLQVWSIPWAGTTVQIQIYLGVPRQTTRPNHHSGANLGKSVTWSCKPPLGDYFDKWLNNIGAGTPSLGFNKNVTGHKRPQRMPHIDFFYIEEEARDNKTQVKRLKLTEPQRHVTETFVSISGRWDRQRHGDKGRDGEKGKGEVSDRVPYHTKDKINKVKIKDSSHLSEPLRLLFSSEKFHVFPRDCVKSRRLIFPMWRNYSRYSWRSVSRVFEGREWNSRPIGFGLNRHGSVWSAGLGTLVLYCCPGCRCPEVGCGLYGSRLLIALGDHSSVIIIVCGEPRF
ncbi:hypothetical protein RRG08_066083 [Elysia crispata]|uniref:Uncharacterized protein n=1 Tax=Elysia crispata TaxID=231223 RepID=A0AAE0YDR6_9GAST|nr:hypothetical protein RRG08_066083 [Elysia crispata]